MTVIRYFINLKLAFSKKLLDLEYLLNCRNLGVIPVFLKIKRKHFLSAKQTSYLENVETRLLRDFIKDLRKSIAFLELKIYYLHLELADRLSQIELDNVLHTIEMRTLNLTKSTKERHSYKLAKLIQYTSSPKITINNKNSFINLSDIHIQPNESKLLNYGPKYSPPLPLNIEKTLIDFEAILRNIDPKLSSSLRGHIIWTCLKIKREEINKSEKLKQIQRGIKYLQQNKNFRILLADKGKNFVIIPEQTFLEKLDECITDLKATIIQENPTDSLVKKVKNLIKKYPSHKTEIRRLPLNPSIPTLNVKIKTHKENLPLRPIVNRTISPVYYLEKYISSLLLPLISDSPYITDSSIKMLEKLSNIKLEPTSKFYSLDVVSLYPSIPLSEAKNIILNKCKKHPTLKKESAFIDNSLDIIFNSNYFCANNIIYKQEQGAPMGSSLAPRLGEIIMQHIEDTVITNSILKPQLYVRYVDDIFIIWPYTQNNLINFKNQLNDVFPTINLTLEHEHNRSLPFLDILIHRNHDNTILWTEPYHKPSSPLSIIPATSYTPIQYKVNAIMPLIRRAYTHSTFEISRNKELQLIKNAMINNGYTSKLFKTLKLKIELALNSTHTKTHENIKYVGSIPYHPHFQTITKSLKNHNYRIAFQTNNLENLLLKRNKSYPPIAGIYRIPIQTPDDILFYIGKTERSLSKRIYEHKYSLTSDYGNTALKNFLLSNNNVIPLWIDAKIIAKAKNSLKLDIQEKLTIIKYGQKAINIAHSQELANIWAPMLPYIKAAEGEARISSDDV